MKELIIRWGKCTMCKHKTVVAKSIAGKWLCHECIPQHSSMSMEDRIKIGEVILGSFKCEGGEKNEDNS